MFAYIKGKIASKSGSSAVIETGGIGYHLVVPLSTMASLGPVGTEALLHTHLYVREDNLSLYGFATLEELAMFGLLITVSGIGPKAAMSVISAMTPSNFSLAVITGDSAALSKAQGIGSKTAQKIILELKDKLKKDQMALAGVAAASGEGLPDRSDIVTEAVSALMILGYTAVESSKAVSKAYKEGMDLETLIKKTLREFAAG